MPDHLNFFGGDPGSSSLIQTRFAAVSPKLALYFILHQNAKASQVGLSERSTNLQCRIC